MPLKNLPRNTLLIILSIVDWCRNLSLPLYCDYKNANYYRSKQKLKITAPQSLIFIGAFYHRFVLTLLNSLMAVKKIIRASFHHFVKDANTEKLAVLQDFIKEYRSAVLQCIDYIWGLKLEWGKADNRKTWDREKGLLDCPSMISTKDLGYTGPLSGRALKCAATQACGIVRAVSNKRRKDLNKKQYLLGLSKPIGKGLAKRIQKGMTKPDCQSINCELNSICMNVRFESEKHFDGFVNLKSLWNPKTSQYKRGFAVRIPIKHYRQSLKWRDFQVGDRKTVLLKSILLNEGSVTLRWHLPKVPKRKEGKTIAIDQGKITCFTSSDGQSSGKDCHDHTLSTIVDKLARKRWGSAAFKKASDHRTNYVNGSVHQLNLSGVREIKYEEIVNINFGRNVSREMRHWLNTVGRDSINKICEEKGVLFTHVPNEFNSQRCHVCGWVQKANRKKGSKQFLCKHCGHKDDADFNASQNILVRDTLFPLPYGFRALKWNRVGFFWFPSGFYDKAGQELTVPVGPRSS